MIHFSNKNYKEVAITSNNSYTGSREVRIVKRNRRVYSFSLDPELYELARKQAEEQRMSISRYTEVLLAQQIGNSNKRDIADFSWDELETRIRKVLRDYTVVSLAERRKHEDIKIKEGGVKNNGKIERSKTFLAPSSFEDGNE